MSGVKGKPGKAIIKADTSNKGVLIPELDREKSEIIIGLLSSLLEPVGRHRATYAVNSKGKSSRKRKRAADGPRDQASEGASLPSKPAAISDYLTTGFNSTTRLLEAEAGLSRPESLCDTETSVKGTDPGSERHLAVVFLPKPRHDMMYAHLPVLCYTASMASKGREPTRLVVLDPLWERKISESMGLPRTGVLGVLEGAPGATSMLKYVRDNVEPIQVPWMQQAMKGDWMGVAIESLTTPGQE